jgi:hypothetical protein
MTTVVRNSNVMNSTLLTKVQKEKEKTAERLLSTVDPHTPVHMFSPVLPPSPVPSTPFILSPAIFLGPRHSLTL